MRGFESLYGCIFMQKGGLTLGLIHFKGLDNRTYVLSDCKSHETRACGYKYPAKGIYELIYDNRTVRVSKKEFDRAWSLTDPETNSGGG